MIILGICVGRIIKLGKSDNGGNRKAIFNTKQIEGVYLNSYSGWDETITLI